MSASGLPFSALGRLARPPTIARLMTVAIERPELLSLAAGFTDNATLPVADFRAAVERLTAGAGPPDLLQYGPNQGRAGLRRRIRELVAGEDHLAPEALSAEDVIVTNGSQQALYLAMQVLANPGDLVLVDRPSYFVLLEMLAGLGLRAVSMPVDATGRLDGAALRRRLAGLAAAGDLARLRAVYFVSYFANPSGRSWDEDEKNDLAAGLRGAGVRPAVIEDAAYRQLWFDAPPASRSVLALPAWREFPRLYTGTFTKPFATGLKIGYGLCTDRGWLERMLHIKGHHDFGSAHANQVILEDALERGVFAAHAARLRPAYTRKGRVLDEALRTAGLADRGWRWERPAGGLYLWLTGPEGLDAGLEGEFFRRCVDEGVLYVPGELCYGDDPQRNTVRLSFGVLPEDGLREAARRFAAAAG